MGLSHFFVFLYMLKTGDDLVYETYCLGVYLIGRDFGGVSLVLEYRHGLHPIMTGHLVYNFKNSSVVSTH